MTCSVLKGQQRKSKLCLTKLSCQLLGWLYKLDLKASQHLTGVWIGWWGDLEKLMGCVFHHQYSSNNTPIIEHNVHTISLCFMKLCVFEQLQIILNVLHGKWLSIPADQWNWHLQAETISRNHFIILLVCFYLCGDYIDMVFAFQLCLCQEIHNNEKRRGAELTFNINFPKNTSKRQAQLQVNIKRDMFFHVMSHLGVEQSKSTQLGQIIESSPECVSEKEKAELIYTLTHL